MHAKLRRNCEAVYVLWAYTVCTELATLIATLTIILAYMSVDYFACGLTVFRSRA